MPTTRLHLGSRARAALLVAAVRSATLAASLLLFAGAATAVQVESLYTARVPLSADEPDARNTAYERALQQVLIRMTGAEDAAFSPELKALFPNPARYVLQYRPGENNTLWVSLDGAAIEEVLRNARRPVWGRERPLTVLWLAVDRGQGVRELLTAARTAEEPSAQPNTPAELREHELRERVQRVAEARGIPVTLPPADLLREAGITISDVWGGFHEPLMAASRELGANSILVGRLQEGATRGNRWSYYFGSQQRSWNGDPEDAIHLIADTLASEFAIAGNASRESIALTVGNVRSVRDYAEVQRLMAELPVVDDFRIDTVTADRIRYRVSVNGGADRLATALDFNGELERTRQPADGVVSAPGEPPSLNYLYRP